MIRHLFSPEGEAALAATMATRPLLAFDFDGTLAPIVARPENAGVPQPVARRLERLAALLPLAIVTGRTVADVRDRLSFVPRFIVGSHGAEDPDVADGTGVEIFDGLRARLRQHAADWQRAGVTVEDKGHSLALHYRLARDRKAAAALIGQLLSGLGPQLKTYGGKCVVNVVAADAPDKAGALARLVARCGASSAVFSGDDVNDEPVFARDEPTWLTVRVGRDDPNTRAKFCIDGASEMAIMLERMLVLAEARA
jgi:trehalose 6-phosphate phosphatase